MNTDKIKKVILLLVIISAGGSMLINLQNGFERWSWQLCTLMWAANTYILEKQIQKMKSNDTKL